MDGCRFAAHYIFSRRFFEVWVGYAATSSALFNTHLTLGISSGRLSIVWTFIAGIFCVSVSLLSLARGALNVLTRVPCGGSCSGMPIWESRREIGVLARSTVRVMTGRTAKEDVLA